MDYQTPPDVAMYMKLMIPPHARTVLEPTPGRGNIVATLGEFDVTAPDNFFELTDQHFDCVIMNPPFSTASAFGVPEDLASQKGLKLGYYILKQCMQMSDHVIALMPWFTISDSDVRLRELKKYGIKSITALPRKTFKYVRIQTCIFELQRNYTGETKFHVYELLTK